MSQQPPLAGNCTYGDPSGRRRYIGVATRRVVQRGAITIRNLLKWLVSPAFSVAGARRLEEHVRRGDLARDRREWPEAAAAYEAALSVQANLPHIWVQRGHALKEARDFGGAENAYRTALRLEPGNSDTFLNLGHLYKLQANLDGARDAYRRALQMDGGNVHAQKELESLLDIQAGSVLAAIIAGDAARDRGDLQIASECYADALASDPSLTHIWVQYGHMLKEGGDLSSAEGAYRMAAGTNPSDPDSRTHLGHVLKLQSRLEEAGLAYLSVLEIDPLHSEARGALHGLARAGARIDGARYTLALRGEIEAKRAGRHAIIFDVTDLVLHLRHRRLPTGIQRVQIETIVSLLRAPIDDLMVEICGFSEHLAAWTELPAEQFLEVCDLALNSGESQASQWAMASIDLETKMLIGPPCIFQKGASLVNLGTSWTQRDYFRDLEAAKARYGIRYVPFVHDLIPVVALGYHLPELKADFETWIAGVFVHADAYLANSKATRADLIAVAADAGRLLTEDDVHVISLDADFRRASDAMSSDALSRFSLGAGDYVLFVSTIEARKNHVAAFRAWRTLIDAHGVAAIPKLVCVGAQGWLNDEVFAHLKADDVLREHVSMLSDVSDADLAALYQGCAFTLYPSRYEGWGLPVTEALSYGKATLTSNVSSLPEAGGCFADYFDLESPADLVAKLERLILEPAYRQAREAAIRKGFRPRTWREIAVQIVGAAIPPSLRTADIEGG